jgi:hypothetical protein
MSTKKRLLDSSLKSFFSPSTKEATASRAFNGRGISTSSGGILLDLSKKKNVVKKPVGRNPKKLNQSTLLAPAQVAKSNSEETESLLMSNEDLGRRKSSR